ncbi:MAG: hypothetical protein C0406_04735 [Sideroxydans sp.]|nr:hypothetical protein [Sideroxydans sp.]
MTKSYYLNEHGDVEKQDFQNAYRYKSQPIACNDIQHLSEIIRGNASRKEVALIRGCDPAAKEKIGTRSSGDFPEHSEGTPWVMLDIDGIDVPEGMSTISQEAVEWLIQQKLPEPFKAVKCFYQFSSSAGVCKSDGSLLKDGLRVHLFYFLNRRVLGKTLDAFLSLHCLEAGFFEKAFDKGGTPIIRLGIDPAPIRSSVQVHYFALPIIGAGVVSLLSDEDRFGWVNEMGLDVVSLPEISNETIGRYRSEKARVIAEWKIENGYQERHQIISSKNGIAVTNYYASADPSLVRRGRKLSEYKLSDDKKRVLLRFTDENTPWSWYVNKLMPQIAYRFGDGERIPLKELSESAFTFVRDELDWFAEVPHRHMSLTEEGFIPPFDFIEAKHALIISPTGSGKTTKVIDFIRRNMVEHVVIYVAQTIPLVNQMRADLAFRQVNAKHYRDVHPSWELKSGVVVTTNESLPKILRELTPNASYILIIDEIHRALDDFHHSNSKQELFERAINGAIKVLYMSGTFTPVQRTMLASTIQKLHGGRMTNSTFCCYEFASVKSYPLHLVDSDMFYLDFIELLKAYQAIKNRGEVIPRTVLLVDTSHMEVFKVLVEEYNLESLTVVVSRPECLEDEVEAARCSDARILISSPLFSIGLNFEEEPEVLWCKVSLLPIDTSQIIQAINRGNRGEVRCETRLYHGSVDTAPFEFPVDERLQEIISNLLLSECDIHNDGFDMGQLIERVSYLEKRELERNSSKAMGLLIRSGGFQNHIVAHLVRGFEVTGKAKFEAAEVIKQAKSKAKIKYEEMAEKHLPYYLKRDPFLLLSDHRNLSKVRRDNYKSPDPLREREIDAEEIAINMGFVGCGYSDAKKVDVGALRVVWGDLPPWISERYRPVSCGTTNEVYAEKLDSIIHFVSQLNLWNRGELNTEGLLSKLTQDKKFGNAYVALANSESMFVKRRKKLDALMNEAIRLRSKGGKNDRNKHADAKLALFVEWMASIGIRFEKNEASAGVRSKLDTSNPNFPEKWNFERLEKNLMRYAETIKSLPVSVIPPVSESEFPEKYGVLNRCQGCVYFHDLICYLGHGIDWSELGIGDPCYSEAVDCDSFKKAKVSRTLPYE